MSKKTTTTNATVNTATAPTKTQENMGFLIVRLMRDLDGYAVRIVPNEKKHFIKLLVNEESTKCVEIWVTGKDYRICTEYSLNDNYIAHTGWAAVHSDRRFSIEEYKLLAKDVEYAITHRQPQTA